MSRHQIEPGLATVHGPFSRERPPILTVESGDTVVLRTLDARWNVEPQVVPGVNVRTLEPRQDGHALCGPIAVSGAEPGMVLEVELVAIEPGTWGWTAAAGLSTPLNDRLGLGDSERFPVLWQIDRLAGTATNHLGHSVRLRPFMGVIGMPPAEPGEHSTGPPRATGGNIDCKELIVGSRLYLPIAVPGGLLSIGDGHAAQGDGEVSGTAIECPMDRCEVILRLHADLQLRGPRAETPAGWVTFGFDADLHEAAALALEGMLDLLQQLNDCDRREALVLASVAADLRVTQLVNGTVGAHMILPPGAVS